MPPAVTASLPPACATPTAWRGIPPAAPKGSDGKLDHNSALTGDDLRDFANGNEAPLADLCDVKHGYAFEGEFFSQQGDYVLLTPGSFFETGGYRERGEKRSILSVSFLLAIFSERVICWLR